MSTGPAARRADGPRPGRQKDKTGEWRKKLAAAQAEAKQSSEK